MRKQIFTLLAASAISAAAAFTSFAGSWQVGSDANAGRWWYDNGNGTYASNGWFWIDGNNDGISECYYFDAEGWLYVSSTTPDGYTVDPNGAWTVNGVIQTQAASQQQSQGQKNSALKGWQEMGGCWYYYVNGEPLTSQWKKINGAQYYFDDLGIMATDFQDIDGDTYYFSSDGALKTKDFVLNDVHYVVNKNGVITEEVDTDDWWSYKSGGSSSGSSGSSGSKNSGSSSNTFYDTPEENDTTEDSNGDRSDYAYAVLDLVNEEREKEGRAPLSWNDTLGDVAATRAEELTEKFSHLRPNGELVSSLLKEAGLSYHGWGENIAMGQTSPAQVMNSWMNSSGHRANILKESYEEIGIGCYYYKNTYYWVQVFMTE